MVVVINVDVVDEVKVNIGPSKFASSIGNEAEYFLTIPSLPPFSLGGGDYFYFDVTINRVGRYVK